jgi:hypothetical protein
MRIATSSARPARRTLHRAATLLLATGLVACSQGTAPAAGHAPLPESPAPVAASTTPAPMQPATRASSRDAELAAAIARDAAVRADREQTLRVQQQLRAQQRARQAAQQAPSDMRCLAGQRMRRVANGWVQAGTC